ncbi:MAG: glycosyltransferase, partial [Pyrinomonadaceae bacterium]
TRDHDGPLNRSPYNNVKIDAWNGVGNARVYYLSPRHINRRTLVALMSDVNAQAIYLNSFFSPLTVNTLYLRKRKKVGDVPIVLAPEGEFSTGALELKKLKKQLYITAAKALSLLNNIIWKAAAESEVEDINRVLGPKRKIMVAPNLPPLTMFPDYDQDKKPSKAAAQAKMIFLSRFMRKKNFNWLVPHLHDVRGDLLIDIWGPIEDQEYWAETQRLLKHLPSNVTIEAKGPVSHDRVSETLSDYHYFILPTSGENFGHVFIEAFAAGSPVITSDQTPWRGLEEKGIGFDLSFNEPDKWKAAIDKCLAANGDEFREHSERARKYAVDWLTDPEVESSNRAVLQFAVQPAIFS